MHHLVGTAEVATMIGVSKERVRQLMEGFADFPKPEVELSAGRIWARSAVEKWIETHRVQRSDGVSEVGLFKRFTPQSVEAMSGAHQEAMTLSHEGRDPAHAWSIARDRHSTVGTRMPKRRPEPRQ